MVHFVLVCVEEIVIELNILLLFIRVISQVHLFWNQVITEMGAFQGYLDLLM